MNPFSPGDGSFPEPPLDIPVPETPPVDFRTVGQQFAEGQHQALDNWTQKLNLNCVSGTGTKPQSWADTWSGIWNGDFLFCWFQKATKWVMGNVVLFLTWSIQQIFQVFDLAESPMNQMFTATIAGMFGVSGGGLAKGASGLPTHSAGVDTSVLKVITDALSTAAPKSGAGGIAPSSAGADKFMEMAAHMAIEGWLIGWAADALSVHELEQIGDLKDTLERTLGIGRLSRRALHAPMKIFVEDPYTQLLNQTFHPTLLDKGELVRYYLRGGIDRAGLQAKMDLHGYASGAVDQLIYDQVKTV